MTLATAVPPTPPPPTLNNDPNDGFCSDTTWWFFFYVALGVCTWLVNVVVDRFAQARPTPGKVNYGRPWPVVHLLLSILVWNTLPAAFGFALFHFIVPHDRGTYLSDAARVTCTQLYGSVPYLGIFFALQGALILVVYQAKPYTETIARLLLPSNHIREMIESQSPAQKACYHAPTILMYGSASRGNVYLEVLKRALSQYDADPELRSKCNPPRVMLADVAKTRSFVAVNADAMELPPGSVEVLDVGPIHVIPAMGVASGGVSPSDRSMVTSHNDNGNETADQFDSKRAIATRSFSDNGANAPAPLQLPVMSASVDEVLVTPFIRKMAPIGDFITDPATVRHHMQLAAAEIRRVLRPGGRVRIVDTLIEVLAAEADFVAEGFTVVQPTHSLHCNTGSVVIFKSPMYGCVLEAVPASAGDAERLERLEAEMAYGLNVRQSEVLRGVPSNAFREPASANLYDDPADGGVSDARLLAPASPTKPDEFAVYLGGKDGESRTVYQAGRGAGYRTLLLCQFVVFLVLLWLAAAVAHPLDVPARVPVGTRVATLPFSVAYNFPMMAYFSRMIAAAKPPTVSLGALVGGSLRSDMLTTLAALALSCVTYVPQLALQWGLASTSLSLDTRSYIAIAISVLIGVGFYKRGKQVGQLRALRSIDVSEERYKGLLAAA